MRGLNTCGGFNHRRHETARRQLKEWQEHQERKERENRLAAQQCKDLRGGGFIVTFRAGEDVEVVFVWAESVAQARCLAWHHCTPKSWEEVVARPTGLTYAGRKVGLVKFN